MNASIGHGRKETAMTITHDENTSWNGTVLSMTTANMKIISTIVHLLDITKVSLGPWAQGSPLLTLLSEARAATLVPHHGRPLFRGSLLFVFL